MNKINHLPELLAPSGSYDQSLLAINHGANAIYLGISEFNARRMASNFTLDEIQRLLPFAHLVGVKVYITFNVLIEEQDWERAIFTLSKIIALGPDALIVTDLGIIDYLHQHYPTLPLHLSTQSNFISIEQADFFQKLGITRLILGREVHFSVIKMLKENYSFELEIFIHGALCVSYSGQCYFSALTSGRSGNKGNCGQLCRYQYQLQEDNKTLREGYLLSMKDLCTIDHLEKIIPYLDCLKIEGRNRSDEYLVATVDAYRSALDSLGTTKNRVNYATSINKMKETFNREFTKGYLFGEKPELIVNPVRPNNQGYAIGQVVGVQPKYVSIRLTRDLQVGDGIRILSQFDYGKTVESIEIKGEKVKIAHANQTIKVPFHEPVRIGDQVQLTHASQEHHLIQQSLRKPAKLLPLYLEGTLESGVLQLIVTCTQKTIKLSISEIEIEKPCSLEKFLEQFDRLGDTPFYLDKYSLNFKSIFLTLKDINNLKRDAIAQLNTLLQTPLIYEKIDPTISDSMPEKQINHLSFSVKINTLEQHVECLNHSEISIIYYPANLQLHKKAGLIYIPVYAQLDYTKSNLYHRLSAVPVPAMVGDYFLNILNYHALTVVTTHLFPTTFLSPENHLPNYRAIAEKCDSRELALVGYLKPQYIISKINLNLNPQTETTLSSKQNKVILRTDDNHDLLIYGSKPIVNEALLDPLVLAKTKEIRFDFLDESTEETNKVLQYLIKIKNLLSNL